MILPETKHDISIGMSFDNDVLRSATAFVHVKNKMIIVDDNDNLDKVTRYIFKLINLYKEYIKKSLWATCDFSRIHTHTYDCEMKNLRSFF